MSYIFTMGRSSFSWKDRLKRQRELRIKYRNSNLVVVGLISEGELPLCPQDCEEVGYYHTHPSGGSHNEEDKDLAWFGMKRSYVGGGGRDFLGKVY